MLYLNVILLQGGEIYEDYQGCRKTKKETQ